MTVCLCMCVCGARTGPTLLLVQTMDGAVLGACMSDAWRAAPRFVSVEQACLFDLAPRFAWYPTAPAGPRTERNHVYYNAEAAAYAAHTLTSILVSLSRGKMAALCRGRRQGIGFGGTLAAPRLWIDSLLQSGWVDAAACKTYVRPASIDDLVRRPFAISQVRHAHWRTRVCMLLPVCVYMYVGRLVTPGLVAARGVGPGRPPRRRVPARPAAVGGPASRAGTLARRGPAGGSVVLTMCVCVCMCVCGGAARPRQARGPSGAWSACCSRCSAALRTWTTSGSQT
jgi:hypothetical protein